MAEKKKKKGAVRRFIGRLFLVLFLALFCAAGFMFGKAYTWILQAKTYLPADDRLKTSALTSYVYDKNGKITDDLSGGISRDWTSIMRIPKMVQNGFISIEDERFYSHKGIDIRRIAGALWNDLRTGSRSQGASTITQQYIKLFVLQDTQRSFKRKVQEQYLAIQYEKQFSKQQILEAYLNSINLGHGAYGVTAAAKIYFGKKLKDLTIAEIACIASMPQAPSDYDPYVHYASNIKRQHLVLRKMLQLGYITPSQYTEALSENIKAHLHNSESNSEHIHSYFVDSVIEEARQRLKSVGMNPDTVYNGGLKIYSTLDPSIQKKMDKNFNLPWVFPNLQVVKGYVQPQAAMVLLDYHTGEVRGLLGGRGKKTGNLVFNRAVDSLRQPGSSIKPLGVYGPAIDAYGYNEYSTIVDSPISFKGGYSPHNWYPGFRGAMTFKEALTISANVPACKVVNNIGLNVSYKYLTQKFHISSLTSSDKYSVPSLALGGLTTGVSVMDMTAAYGTIANKGVYIEPHTIRMIKDKDGNIIYDDRKPKGYQVLRPDTAVQLTDMMQSVIAAGDGTGTDAKFKSISMAEAGKTGTTTAEKDKWFMGYTPYYCGGVWMGFDQPQVMNISKSYQVIAWRAVMEAIHKGLPAINFFETPAGVTPAKIATEKKVVEKNSIKVKICVESGLRAGPWCPPEDVREKIYPVGQEPTDYCNIHVPSSGDSGNSSDSSNDSGNNDNSYNSVNQNNQSNQINQNNGGQVQNGEPVQGSTSGNNQAGTSEGENSAGTSQNQAKQPKSNAQQKTQTQSSTGQNGGSSGADNAGGNGQ